MHCFKLTIMVFICIEYFMQISFITFLTHKIKPFFFNNTRVFRGTKSPHCLAWPTCKFKIGDVYSKDLGEWKSLDLIISPVIQHNFLIIYFIFKLIFIKPLNEKNNTIKTCSLFR